VKDANTSQTNPHTADWFIWRYVDGVPQPEKPNFVGYQHWKSKGSPKIEAANIDKLYFWQDGNCQQQL